MGIVLLERCSFLITPPMVEILDHPERVAMNGQVVGALEIGNKVNRLKLVNAIQGVGGLGIKLDSLKGY